MPKISLYVLLFLVTVQAVAQEPDKMLKKITGVTDSYPALSPDGKKIAFQSNRTGNQQIHVMDINGRNMKQLTFDDKHENSTPVWSPDGKRIVFASERDGDSEVYIMNADGSDQKRLTNQKGDDAHPNFSPDGRKIVFNSARNTPDLTVIWSRQVHEIFMMNLDGSDVKQVSRFGGICTYPSISPDGKKICFRQVVNEPGFNFDMTINKRTSEIFVMNIEGTDVVNISNSPAYEAYPLWTKDGHVLFSSNRGGIPNVCQLYRSDARGKKVERISYFKHSLTQASLSPDGKMVYCQYEVEEEPGFESGGLMSLVLPPTATN
jgi:TolB protein